MKRILLTGFGPFESVVNNPSQRVVEHFALNGYPGHKLTTHLFPVAYARVAGELGELLGESGDVPFDRVVMLGVNCGKAEWRVERYATNRDRKGSVDADGERSAGERIEPGMPDKLKATLSVRQIVNALRSADIPVTSSVSAGRYLCNHLMYRTLLRLHDAPAAIGGFVHIPPDPETFGAVEDKELANARPFEMHVRAIEVILRELA